MLLLSTFAAREQLRGRGASQPSALQPRISSIRRSSPACSFARSPSAVSTAMRRTDARADVRRFHRHRTTSVAAALAGAGLGLQFRDIGLDSSERLHHLFALLFGLLTLLTSLFPHEPRSDGGGEEGEKADADEHQNHPDHPAADGMRSQIAVSDRRDRDDCPPEPVPERFELGFRGVLCGSSKHYGSEGEDGGYPEGVSRGHALLRLQHAAQDRSKASEADEPCEA